MSPEFASAVDRVFAYVLSVMDDVESGGSPVGEEVRLRTSGLIDQAQSQLGQTRDWELAKYALVAWVDDLLIDSPWVESGWWEQNRLEFQYFRTADAFTKFYEQAKDATMLPRKDALEVFYLCVVLGFRGVYRDAASSKAHADAADLPPTLEDWAKRAAIAIELRQGRPLLVQHAQQGVGAPALEAKYLVVGFGLFTVILIIVTILTAKFVFWPG